MGTWIVGAVMGVVALLGLFLASRAHDDMFGYFGLAVFAFGVLFIFGMVLRGDGTCARPARAPLSRAGLSPWPGQAARPRRRR